MSSMHIILKVVGWNPSLNSSVTVSRLSTRSQNIQRLELECTEFHTPLEDYVLIFSSARFAQLEEVLLIGTDIDDQASLNTSGRPSNLKRLTLRECEKVTGAGLLGFAHGRGSKFFLTCRLVNT